MVAHRTEIEITIVQPRSEPQESCDDSRDEKRVDDNPADAW
jgi:hypothetical protein